MKKITDFLLSIPLAIFYPNRILTLFKVRNLDQRSNQILGNDKVVRLLAFVSAIIFVISVRYAPRPPDAGQRILNDVQIERRLAEGYTDFGSIFPEVDVLIEGDPTEIEFLFATGGINLFVDLTDREQGTHNNVQIRHEGNTGNLTIIPSPSIISGIEIDRLETREFPVRLFLTEDSPELDARYAYEINIDPEYVTISGPERILDTIDTLIARFDPSAITDEQRSIVDRALIVAIDDQHRNISNGIEIYPPAVNIRVNVFENFRRIGIEVSENIFNVPEGYEITSITADVNEIEIWDGAFESVEDVILLRAINFATLEQGQVTLPIPLPENVQSNVTEVVITVEYIEPPPPTEEDDDEEDD